MFRSIQSLVIAVFVTLGLIVGMYALIKMEEPELVESQDLKLPDFKFNPKNEEVQTITPKPQRPDEVEQQPDVPDVQVVADRLDINSNFALGAVKVGINRDLKGFNSNDGEYLPIFRPPPIYPRRAAERGLCGSVDLRYTVTSSGTVTNPEVMASTSSMFESAAKKAALKYKYKPRQVGGKPVDVSGVEIRVVFEMEGGC
ncbi:TonB family protein [Arenicella xantha]|uniref:Protein TonB n=1 Tax=Arenicella xantha TaxID=644221 RepID=A0A395JRT5_9GAMM|nr:TonB family protein [Arenicella xantha]RBP53156.1 outer membrane transport energization protein TonB [Arenicella xantha]